MSLWMARGGKYGEQENISFENNLACIGFRNVPDLSKATSKEEIFELVRAAYPDEKVMAIHNFTGQLRTFAHRMKEGDLVAMPLSLRAPRDERLLGLIITFILVLVYYTIFFISKLMGYNEVLVPWLAAWMQNIVFAVIALFIFVISRK